MDWIESLLFNTDSIVHIVFVLALVIALGVRLGKIKVCGISLGVTFVLFVGLLLGHFNMGINAAVCNFIREFGLILFIFSIGLQVGPGFFQSFKKGGIVLNRLALALIGLNIVVALVIYYCDDTIHADNMIGILSGAVTNTPGLGAAQQTVVETGIGTANDIREMSMGYAAAYPLGVIGIILAAIIIKAVFKIDLKKETEAVEKELEQDVHKPLIITYKVENKLISGRTINKLMDIIDRDFVISRIKKPDGTVIIPTSQSVVEADDYLLMVISEDEEEAFQSFIGPKSEVDWENATPSEVVSRRIVITNNAYNGQKIESLHLHAGYQLNATRVNRAGMDLLARPSLRLQVGDRITVVGNIEDINRLATKLGNSLKRLNEPNMVTLFLGIMLGLILGAIPIMFPGMSVPMKLGVAGGPLVMAILISCYGYKIHLVTYTSSSANLMLRELGICMFLASVGIAAGGDFAKTVFNSTGATWVMYGFLITFIPLIIVGCYARKRYKINYYAIMGLLSGSYTDPPALAYGNKVANNDVPAVAYSTVYPLTMFMRIISAQVLILLLEL